MTATPTSLLVVCGSVSDPARLRAAAQPWILAGHRVYVPTANPLLSKVQHDADHRRWIDAADAVIVVRKPDGTIGESAGAERLYAAERGIQELWCWPEGGQVPTPESEQATTPEQDRNDCHFSRCIDQEHCRLGGRCEAAWAMGAPVPPAKDPRVEAAESVLHDDECDVADGCRCNRAEQDRRVHLARQMVQAVDTVVMHTETNRRALAPEQDRPDRLAEIKQRAGNADNVPWDGPFWQFVENSRDDMRWLIAEVERLRAALAQRGPVIAPAQPHAQPWAALAQQGGDEQ